MRLNTTLTALLLSTASVTVLVSAASAADLAQGVIVQDGATLPAVSGINGKWELDPGIITGGLGARAAGSISIPLSDKFGFQGDAMATITSNGPVFAGAAHLFTRDPSSYLLGVTAGYVVAPGKGHLVGVGPEAELYLDRVSLEAWGGVAKLDYDDVLMTDLTGLFAFGDVAYYPDDNLRLTLGGSHVLGKNALHLGAEYMLQNMGAPLSLSADARLYTSGDYSVTVGIKGYIGGDDSGKSLIDRHRQDDPRNRAVDFFGGTGNLMFAEAPDPEGAACVALGGTWEFEGCSNLPPLNSIDNKADCDLMNEWGWSFTFWNGYECLPD